MGEAESEVNHVSKYKIRRIKFMNVFNFVCTLVCLAFSVYDFCKKEDSSVKHGYLYAILGWASAALANLSLILSKGI